MREIDHPNVVKLKDVIMMPSKMYLVFEYLKMDLRYYLDKVPHGQTVPLKLIKSYMF